MENITSTFEEKTYSNTSNTINTSKTDYINSITKVIIEDLRERGWKDEANNKVLVRYIANGLWAKGTLSL